MQRTFVILLLILVGCTPNTVPTTTPVSQRSEAQVRLHEIAGAGVRRGELVVTPHALQLRIKRGDRSMPFLTVDRGAYQLGCYVEGAPTDELITEDVWWLFEGGEHAVALQMTTYGMQLWYWDETRDCPIRTAALDGITVVDDVPDRYYKSDDAQVAYRWNQNETPFGAFGRLPNSRAPNVTGDAAADFLGVPGEEQLIVAQDLIAIRTADGRIVFQEQFEVDPDWPCYNAQLTIFEEPEGGVYAIASFDTFGTMNDCEAPGGDARYATAIADWDAEEGRFVTSFRLRDLLRPLHPDGEHSTVEVERHEPVAGGRLLFQRRVVSRYSQGTEQRCVDRASDGTCLAARECWLWRSMNERSARFTLQSPDGATIELGVARAGVGDGGEDCGN